MFTNDNKLLSLSSRQDGQGPTEGPTKFVGPLLVQATNHAVQSWLSYTGGKGSTVINGNREVLFFVWIWNLELLLPSLSWHAWFWLRWTCWRFSLYSIGAGVFPRASSAQPAASMELSNPLWGWRTKDCNYPELFLFVSVSLISLVACAFDCNIV